MNKLARRDLLLTRPNPDSRLDTVTMLEGHVASSADGGRTTVALHYVPDKRVLEPAAFGRYLDALGTMAWDSLEQIALAVLDDVNNEVVARWVQIAVSAPDRANPGVDVHRVLVQDRQPEWNNPDLLSRLKRF